MNELARLRNDIQILRGVARHPDTVDVPALMLLPSLEKVLRSGNYIEQQLGMTKEEFVQIRNALQLKKARFEIKLGLREPPKAGQLLSAIQRLKRLPSSEEVLTLIEETARRFEEMATQEAKRRAEQLLSGEGRSRCEVYFLVEWIYHSKKPLSYFQITRHDLGKGDRTLPESKMDHIHHALFFWRALKMRFVVLARSLFR